MVHLVPQSVSDGGDGARLSIAGRAISLDDGGFLVDPRDWSRDVAVELARRDQIELREPHWEVLWCVRRYYLEYAAPPMLRLVTKRTGLDLRRIEELFLTRCRDCMCRIAGLPKPTG